MYPYYIPYPLTIVHLILSTGGGWEKGQGLHASMSEVEEAVRELVQEGLVQYIERTQTVIIRA